MKHVVDPAERLHAPLQQGHARVLAGAASRGGARLELEIGQPWLLGIRTTSCCQALLAVT